jgi:hypothetical protein
MTDPLEAIASKGQTSAGPRQSGAGENRTPDPLVANEMLSQLSYSPNYFVLI